MARSRSRAPLLRSLLAAAVLCALGLAGPATASASQLLYYGGPVVHSANLVLVQWGPDVRSTYTSPSSGDPAFFNYLSTQNGSTSDLGGVLAQYMDATGQNSQNHFSYGGSVQINPAVAAAPPGTVQDSDIQTELAKDITGGQLPAPAGAGGLSTIYVVLFPPNDDVCLNGGCAYTGSGFCAYHGSFTLSGSTHVLYAAMVDDGPGTPNYGYCGPSVSDLAVQTSVVSHEVGETINDPLIGEAPNWGPPLGWYDPTYDGEIADKCDAEPLAANGPWTVEPLWSNTDGNCESGEPAYAAPTASFLGASTGDISQQLSFDASSSSDPAGNSTSALEQNVGSTFSIGSGIVRYQWNWGDGSVNASPSPTTSHAYAAPGTYQVSLTVADSLGFTSTITHQVTIASTGSLAPVPQTGGATGVDSQGATLNGQVNPESQTVSYRFLYGPSPDSLSQSTPLTAGPTGTTSVPVSATLTGLSASTQYYYELVVSTPAGQTYAGSVESLSTASSSTPVQTPVAGTGSVSHRTSTAALLTGTVNPDGPAPVSYAFVYGTSPSSLSRSTASATQAGGTTAALVSHAVTGLVPHTTYYYRLQVSLKGQTYSGALHSFTTPAPTPAVHTGGAWAITNSAAVVSGWVNPSGTPSAYLVEFGPTRAYGYSTTAISAGSGTAARHVNLLLSGLRPSTTYHYRLVAQSGGGTAVGADQIFTTARPQAKAPRFHFSLPARVPQRQLLRHGLRVHFTCTRACTAHFVMIKAPAGRVQTAGVPLTIARGRASLRGPGSGAATLRMVGAPRSHSRRLRAEPLRFVVLGYAVSRGSAASAPRDVRITLT